jgi:acyl-coenzyme A thioesterase PaaI-like protein
MTDDSRDIERPWLPAPPGRLLGRGHPVAELLEAHEWRVLEHEPGIFRIEAHLPTQVKNPRGQLFGGFAGAYVDLLAVYTARTVIEHVPNGLATVNLRIDYFEPVRDAHFILESRVVHSRGKTHLVEVLFKSLEGKLLVFAITTLRQR